MTGAPKQAEKVALGLVTPASVAATLAVSPDMKWYIATASSAFGAPEPSVIRCQQTDTDKAGSPDRGVVRDSSLEEGRHVYANLLCIVGRCRCPAGGTAPAARGRSSGASRLVLLAGRSICFVAARV